MEELLAATTAVRLFAGQVEKATNFVMEAVALQNVVPSSIRKFVEAFSPGLINQFNWALRNLAATFGYAFGPLVAEVAKVAKAFGGIILPLLRDLRPVISMVAGFLGDMFLAAVRMVVAQLRVFFAVLAPFMPMLKLQLDVIVQLTELFGVFVTMAADGIRAFLEWMGVTDAAKGGMDMLRGVINKLAWGVAFVTGHLLKLAGMLAAVVAFRESLEKRIADMKRAPGGLTAAPRDVGTSGIEDIAKKMSERAFAAVGAGAAPKTEVDLLESIVSSLKDVETMDLKTIIKQAVYDGMLPIAEALLSAVRVRAEGAVGAAGGVAADIATSVPFRELLMGGVVDRIGDRFGAMIDGF